MSVSISPHTGTVAVLTTMIVVSWALWPTLSPQEKRQRLRKKGSLFPLSTFLSNDAFHTSQLPPNLETWRMPAGQDTTSEVEEQVWMYLDGVLRDEGYQQWPYAFLSVLKSPGFTHSLSSGFGYAIPSRTEPNGIGNVGRLRRFEYTNPLTRVARTRDGHDVVIRVVVAGGIGHNHLKIIRRLGMGENSLLVNNHALPLFAEFQFEDIIFGVFPKACEAFDLAYGWWAKNSVGDVIDMIMQMLEALAFIHDLNIAHRDAFHNNFLVQWHPESLLTMKISPSRPRVYLIDFEFAIEFPTEYPADECLVSGCPLGGSVMRLEMYGRPHAPEFASGKPYSPFKLDVWQLGISISEFKSTIAPIDEILLALEEPDPILRMSAKQALDDLQSVVHSMSPESLLITPQVTRRCWDTYKSRIGTLSEREISAG